MFDKKIIYSLTANDFINAEQINIRNSSSFWTNPAIFFYLLGLSIIDLKRINEPSFFVFKSFQEIVQKQTTEYHIQNFLFLWVIAIFIIMQNFPRYNPLSRWNISRKYKKDFIKRETKTITIDDAGITRTSDNYRELTQWQAYTKFIEGKTIFLLLGEEQSHIIPKRAFGNEKELNSFRAILAKKLSHN